MQSTKSPIWRSVLLNSAPDVMPGFLAGVQRGMVYSGQGNRESIKDGVDGGCIRFFHQYITASFLNLLRKRFCGSGNIYMNFAKGF